MTKMAHQLSLGVTGKIGNLVYQRVRKGKGNIQTSGSYDLQLRQQKTITDAQSPAQLQGRSRMAAATAAYKNLTDEERAEWKRKANKTHRTGYNLFVREFCFEHPLSEF